IGEGPLSNEASATAGAPPTEPWSLSAVAGNARATLYWNPPNSSGGTPITNHRIYRGTTSGALSLLLEIGNVSTYLNLGLTNGQVYYYQVSAKSAAQEGARSAEVSVIPATVPGSPLNVQASPGDAQVTLNWSPPASSNGRPLIGYRVYRGTSSGTYTWNATLGLVNTYVSSGLTNGVRYYYAVSATNAMGEGSLSSEVSAIPAQFPSEPWDLNTGPGNQRVTLGWNAPNSTGGPPISNYRLYRGFTSGNLSFLAEIGNLTSYIDGGLTNGVTYHYAVSARNGVREGPRSNVVWEIPANIPSAPLAPNATAGEGNATLEWSPPSDNGGRPVTGYKVYRGNSSGVYTWNATVPVSNSYLFTGLTNGVRHYFVVAAINPAGEGPKSQEVSAVPSRIPIPPTVTGTWPLNGTVGITLDSSVIVTFSLPMDPNSTVAAFSITPTVAGGSTATGPQNLTFTHASPFAPNTIYTVTIAKSAKSAVGDAMSWAYWTTFATGTAAKPPQVSSTDPADGAGNVALDYNITVEFDAAMDDVSTIGAVTIYPSIFPAFGNVTGTTLIITHLLVFQPKATYFVNISTAAKSVAGANLGAPYTFSFTTAPLGGGVDPAKIVFTVPQSVIDIGKSTDFYYNVYDAAGRPIGTKDKWDYAPKDVATVEYLGGHRFTVTGLQVGKVKITVTAEGDSATVANFTTLEVRDPGAPPPPDESPIPGVPLWALLGGLAAVIAVAGLLALLLLRKRKRKDLPSPFATSHVAPSGAPSQDQAPPQGYYRPAEAAPAWQPPPPPPPPPAPAFHPEGSVAAAIDVAESRPAPPPRPRRRPGPPGA
ncbi:MAG TPA: fibronectin type III domain-containing protein, partial [Thermoplasmata archaeon]|nr:fibronectin type III domain-containing protein [Thermoplasmata archaeon]